jgi:hypothetical protein
MELKFEIKIKHKRTGKEWTDVFPIEELIEGSPLSHKGIQEIVYARQYVGIKDRKSKETYCRDKINVYCDGKIYRKWENKEVVCVCGAFGVMDEIRKAGTKEVISTKFVPFCDFDFTTLAIEVVGNYCE